MNDIELEIRALQVNPTFESNPVHEEKFKRQFDRETENKKIQKDIKTISIMIFILTLIAVIIGILSFFK
mgnify:FL=1